MPTARPGCSTGSRSSAGSERCSPLTCIRKADIEETEFWRIVGAAREAAGKDVEERPETLRLELERLPLDTIQSFQRLYETLLRRANRWNLWGAAYLMNGGCSDDGFRYFRDWLISEGQQVFEQALDNPDSLATVEDADYYDLESFGYVALGVFESKGGGELERDFSDETTIPSGEKWDEDDLPGMFPRLAERFDS
ncbi:DUF4240 domain-containing protein [Massilia sp. BSC265]|uniref:DUF4240 domain-containing protein n=1 Tax=Massilia sp. BSC265 TaxID=1549812 RepID=UPI0009E03101|nr:DUF4240 domain-containing protein [Massilia sp. BSC265]